jgi:ParB-like chromosome segregation protein Spo0J
MKTATESMPLLLSQIERSSNTQARAALDPDAIAEYRRLLEEGQIETVPFADIFFDGSSYHIGDGWHRFEAFTEAGLESMPCRIRKGSERDARIFACAANQKHGVRRTKADRRRSVELLLADEEWSGKSSRAIAEYCGVSHTTVEKIRAEREESTGQLASSNGEATQAESRVGRDGKERTAPSTREQPSASKTAPSTNGKKKERGGDETITPEQRKAAKQAFGVVVRFADLLGEFEGRDVVNEAMEQLSTELAKHWG